MASEEEIKKIIYEEVPKLIEKDEKVREFILKLVREKYMERREAESRFEKLLEEIKKLHEEIKAIREETRRWMEEQERRWREQERRWQEQERRWQEQERRWQEQERRWREQERRWQEQEKRWQEQVRKWQEQEKRWREQEKRWWENQEKLSRMLDEISKIKTRSDRILGALGARWGLRSEASFRSALRAILEKSFKVKVQRYVKKDKEGFVFGKPDTVELDILVTDNVRIAVEIKSSMSKADIYTFSRKVEFVERKEGFKIGRKIVISPMVDPDAKAVARKLKVEVYSWPEDVKK